MANAKRSNQAASATLLSVVIVVAVLYVARVVLIPLALAILLAFLLGPLVIRLKRWGLGRVPSTLLVVHLAFLLLGIIGTTLAFQLGDLAHKMPEYEQNVRHKINSIRDSGSGLIRKITSEVRNFSEEIAPPSSAGTKSAPEEKPVPVEVRRLPLAPLEMIRKILGGAINFLLTAVIIIVFVIFILIQQEDLRDRLIRLGGARRVNLTTKVMDDVGQRVSRYLLAQLVINSAYGFLTGLGLFCIGVPNPLLWGILAALLRYIPYLGIWIAATMAALVALAVEPGWGKVPAVFGIFGGVDLLIWNFVEPYFYGSSTGISPIAILVAAVFWTWLWGGVGLLLATPLTVCVVVIGRHVPSLEFLSVMLSDEPVLKPETRFYQRLLSMDVEEARQVAEGFLKGKSLEELYDSLFIPALTLAEEDRHRGKMDEGRQHFIFLNMRLLVEDIADRADELIAGQNSRNQRTHKRADPPENQTTMREAAVLCLPARDEADEIAALMLARLLARHGLECKTLAVAQMDPERLEDVTEGSVACVFAVPPLGYLHARHLCGRLRRQCPDLNLVAAILTQRDVEEVRHRQPAIVADRLVTTLHQAVVEILRLAASQQDASPGHARAAS